MKTEASGSSRDAPIQETEPKLHASIGVSPVEVRVGRTHQRGGGLAAAIWEDPAWHKPSWRFTIRKLTQAS